MKWAFVNDQDIVQNIIVYDGKTYFNVPAGLRLLEINDWVGIGDNINKEMPHPPVPTLAEVKALKLDLLLEKRDAVIADGVIVNMHPYYTDDKSISLIHEAITMEGLSINPTFPRLWGLADDTLYEVSFDEMKQVAIAIASKKDACYTNYFVLKAQIESAQTVEAVEAINLDAGWPT